MTLLISIILSGVIGYIPYRLLVYMSLISENNDKNDIFKMIIISIETMVVCYLTSAFYLKDFRINQIIKILPESNLFILFIYCLISIGVMTMIVNPIFILTSQFLINRARRSLNLEKITFKDKRDELFNNNQKPVFIVVRNFENEVISEGALRYFNNQKSELDLLEIQEMDFNVSELPHTSPHYDYHTIIDLKQKVKIEIFRAHRN